MRFGIAIYRDNRQYRAPLRRTVKFILFTLGMILRVVVFTVYSFIYVNYEYVIELCADF